MGNSISSTGALRTVAGLDSYVSELQDIYYEKSLGSSRFLKAIKCRHKEGSIVVKIFVKPESSVSLSQYAKLIKMEREAFTGIPNILPYQLIMETERAGYMIRQFFSSNLYDRISNRPLLTTFEKKWIAFQVLMAIVEAHSRQIYHGDLKTENVFVTSWNWVFLADFSRFKPIFLPEDNPADFSFFFDTSSRRACNLAPERFYAPGDTLFTTKDEQLTAAMDIFGLGYKKLILECGCLIGELFLEGNSIFSLSQLLRYRQGSYDPSLIVEKIDDEHIRSLVKHMIQLNPGDRFSGQQYLTSWRDKAFPECFYSFLHPYMAQLSDPMLGPSLSQYQVFLSTSASPIIADADAKIDRIYFDFDTISESLGIKEADLIHKKSSIEHSDHTNKEVAASPSHSKSQLDDCVFRKLLPVHVNIPKFQQDTAIIAKNASANDGCLILAAVVCTSIRSTIYPTSRLRALDLLLVLGLHMDDEFKLDRIVPYVVSMLRDDNPTIRTNAIATLTQLLVTVKSITSSDANIFPEFILPNLKHFTADSNVLVRAAYAQCIPVLAEVALHFLELAQLLKSESQANEKDMDPSLFQMTYDSNMRDLQDTIQEDVVSLLIDADPLVKRSLLTEIPRLCIFFGRQKTNDIILSHIITYLNDVDWLLRVAFCEAIVSVGMFVGMRGLEEYILPLMVQALTDSEEFVVEKVLNSITSLAELGLIARQQVKELLTAIIPLVCHPNRWIRYGVIAFVSVASRLLPFLDVKCLLLPMITPFLSKEVLHLSETILLHYLKPPIARSLYENTIILSANPKTMPHSSSDDVYGAKQLSKMSSDRTDLVSRLKDLGMSNEDQEKLFAMKYYVSKAAAARLRKSDGVFLLHQSNSSWTDGSSAERIALRDYSATLHTIFLSPNNQNDANPSLSANRGTSDSRSQRRVLINSGLSETGLNASDGTISPAVSTESTSILLNLRMSMRQRPDGIVGDRFNRRSSGRAKTAPVTENVRVIDGQERYIQKLLDKKCDELFPPVVKELGPKISHILRSTVFDNRTKRTRGVETNNPQSIRGWKPTGILVAHFPEHGAKINKLCVAPDHSFFASCSDDGLVKIWDTGRLITNVTNRARLTYSAIGAKVKALTFCENRNSIVASGENGEIHIARIEYIRRQSAATKYTQFQPVKTLKLENEYATLLDHHETENKSLLVYATSRGRLTALDLRCMEQVWSFSVPAHYGTITSLLMSKNNDWVLTGTHRGVLSFWDTRFHLCTNTWRHPSKAPINKLSHYPSNGNNDHGQYRVAMSVGVAKSEVSIWNLKSSQCEEIFCVMGEQSGHSRMSSEPENELIRHYGDFIKPQALPDPYLTLDESSSVSPYKPPKQLGFRSFIVQPEGPFMMTVGGDRKIRYWDMLKSENSYVINGQDDEASNPRYRFETTIRVYIVLKNWCANLPAVWELLDFSDFNHASVKFNVEHHGTYGFAPSGQPEATTTKATQGSTSSIPAIRNLSGMQSNESNRADPIRRTSFTNDGLGGKHELVSSAVPRCHLDCITDIEMIQYPHPMLITGDRDGIINVWQ